MAIQGGDEDPSTGKRARAPLRQAPPDTRPHIPAGVDLERMTDQAIGALATDARVYQRGGMLVGVVTVPEGPAKLVRGVKRAPGSQVIVPLEAGTVRERLASAARWTKFDGRKGEHVGTLPPEAVVSAVLGRREWGGVRALVSVATSPQLRPDGTILQTPGYDRDTGALYWPSESFPDVAEEPSLDAARGALEALREVCCDFPFARPEHESAWIAGLLTMLARGAVDGPVPLFAVDATTRGTGKSRMVDAAVLIAHGHHVARTSMPEEDEEMRKRITAIVLDGDPAVCMDNVASAIALPSLDAVLTSMTWKDRVLGRSANVTAPHRAVWWTTGNNLDLRGDLSRRALQIRLESAMENPEERTGFKHPDLLRWVRDNRPRLVGSCLTILRGHAISGYKYDGPLWGSFEEWSRIIPSALRWAGMPCPLGARASHNDATFSDLGSLRVFIHGLFALLSETGQRDMSVRQLLSHVYGAKGGDDAADGYGDFREAIEAITNAKQGKPPSSVQLSGALRRNRGRVVDGLRIVGSDPDSRTRVVRWSAQQVEGQGEPPES